MVRRCASRTYRFQATRVADTVAPLIPAPNELTSAYWNGAREHKLVIQRCRSCSHWQHWPESVCSNCLSFDLGYEAVEGKGTVYTYEIATQAFHPAFADRLPFVIAVVELLEQPNLKLVTNLVDFPAGAIEVGALVEVTFQRLDDRFVLPVFRPAA